MSVLKLLSKQQAAPAWLATNTHLLVTHGSRLYNYHTPESDYDFYGFVMPPKDILFPHVSGLINGFDDPPRWEQVQLQFTEGRKEYDFHVYNIVKFFRLLYDNNPNMLEVVYAPANRVAHATELGWHVIDNRRLFLSKRVVPKLRGYAFSQLGKLERKPTGKRAALVAEHGFDTKCASHVVRLVLQAEQILTIGTLTPEVNGRILKSIRQGEWLLEEVKEYFKLKLVQLEGQLSVSSLPEQPDKDAVRTLLYECLEMHYGSIKNLVAQRELTSAEQTLREIREVLSRRG